MSVSGFKVSGFKDELVELFSNYSDCYKFELTSVLAAIHSYSLCHYLTSYF